MFAHFSLLGASWGLTGRIFRNLLPFSAFETALGSIWQGFGLPKLPFCRPKRLVFPWFSSIMHELLQETLACIYCGFSFPLAARRYVRSTSAASRRECRACQIEGPRSKNALLKSIAKISGQEFMARCLPSCLPPILFPSPQGRTDRCTDSKLVP